MRKGLYSEGEYKPPTIALANQYSRKVLGRILGDRSVWNLDPVERWIAPENFQERLLDNVRHRLTFDAPDDMRGDKPFISTAPLPVALNNLGIEHSLEFVRSPISVQRYRVPHCDAHQTVYFPDRDIGLYRASITGDVLIVESISNTLWHWSNDINSAFGINLDDCEPLGSVSQEFGKIINLPDAQRRALLYRLSANHGLYSLGRFAQWRNILLDDVVHDIGVIRKLMSVDLYQLRKAAS